MNRFLVSAARIVAVILAIFVVASVSLSVLESRDMSASIRELNSFCNSVPLGTPQAELAARAEKVQGFRFTNGGGTAFVSLHTCHCTLHFAQERVISFNRAVCND
jgi:hypothetical protein